MMCGTRALQSIFFMAVDELNVCSVKEQDDGGVPLVKYFFISFFAP